MPDTDTDRLPPETESRNRPGRYFGPDGVIMIVLMAVLAAAAVVYFVAKYRSVP